MSKRFFQISAVVMIAALLIAQQPVNVSKVAGTVADTNSGNKSAGTQRIVIATDQPQLANKLLVTPDANSAVNVAQKGGTAVVADPCEANTKTYTPINMSTATTTRIIAPTSAKKTYVCSFHLLAAGADNVAWIEGTGGTCGTATAGMAGGTTAASGYNFAANGGIVLGSGIGSVMNSAGTNVDVCLITSAAVQLSGGVAWVQQ